MRKVTFSLRGLRAMPRPSLYIDELAECALERTGAYMTFDADGECYRRLKAKYASYRPTPEEIRRARGFARQAEIVSGRRLGWDVTPGQGSRRRLRLRGCAGCQGAKAVRGVDRSAAVMLYQRRKTICDACDDRENCVIADQDLTLQRRILSDAQKLCPADPPRW